MTKISLLFVIIFAISLYGYSKDIDSLQNTVTSEISEVNFERLLEISKSYLRHNPDTSYHFAKQASRIATVLNRDKLLVRSLRTEAACCYYIDKQQAIDIYLKEAAIQEKIGDKSELAVIYKYIGLSYRMMGDPTLAVENYLKSLNYANIANDIPAQIEALRNVGLAQKILANYDIALEYYLSALKLAIDNELPALEAGIHNNIANIYRKLSDDEKALNYFNKALTIYQNLNDSAGMSGLYNNIGILYKNKQQYDSALVYYQTALEINQKILFWRYVSKNLGNISTIYRHLGDYEKALDYAFQAKDLREKQGMIAQIFSSNYSIGNIYLEMKQYDNALKYYNIALNMGVEKNSFEEISQTHNKIHLVYEAMGKYKLALDHFKLHQEYKDTDLNAAKEKSILEIEAKYKVDEREKENKLLRLEKESDRKAQIYLIVITIAMLLILTLLAYFFIQKSRLLKRNKQIYEKEKELNTALKKNSEFEKKRLEELVYAEHKINQLQSEKLLAKNKELSNIVLNVHNKNVLLNKIEQEIAELEKSDKLEISSIKKLKQYVSGKHIIEEDWHEFKAQIESVYIGFFDRLEASCPRLTANEQRLSSYLLIELSTKEIAELLNVTSAAVNKSRQRLRKKLNIDSTEDFATYLRQI